MFPPAGNAPAGTEAVQFASSRRLTKPLLFKGILKDIRSCPRAEFHAPTIIMIMNTPLGGPDKSHLDQLLDPRNQTGLESN